MRIVLALLAAAAIGGCGYWSLPTHANVVCRGHGGVRSVDYQGGVVVCGDGGARSL